MSKFFDLAVSSTPGAGNKNVHTNLAYISYDLYNKIPKKPVYLKVNNAIFSCTPHKKMKDNIIGLNKLQRNFGRVSMNKTYNFELFEPPGNNFKISSITFECSFVNENTGYTMNEGKLDGKELIDHIQKSYDTQIFSKNQTFAISFYGILLFARVLDIECYRIEDLDEKNKKNRDDDDDLKLKKLVTHGLFSKTTDINLEKKKTSLITFLNMPSGGQKTKEIFKKGMTFENMGIGGLDLELGKIFRRAFASRIYPPEVIKSLGVQHIKGIMLYGPPGCGKTLMARQIGKMLNCKKPKLVNGPEILNKYVGESEENIRKLFKEAEEEYKEKGEHSDLHLIIFDEIDAICKQRGTNRSGTGVNDSIVNQLLSKIDGVDPLNNVLIIGMTNRLDMIDEALLRPGRFEVKMEIGLPNEKGRHQIFRIHTKKMREGGFMAKDVDLNVLAAETKNFSGSEIEGIVKSATSFALNRKVDLESKNKTGTIDDIKITMNDFKLALEEVKPAFGVSQDELESYLAQGLIDYGKRYKKIVSTISNFINQVKTSKVTNLLSVLLEGNSGTGKTTLAAHLAAESGFPFVKIISPEAMIGMSDMSKINLINKMFNDAHKSPLSFIVLDNIESLIKYVPIGPSFSNAVLQALMVLLKKPPPKNRKLFVIATTSFSDALDDLGFLRCFNVCLEYPMLRREEVKEVLIKTKACKNDSESIPSVLKVLPSLVSIQKLLVAIEIARSRDEEKNIQSDEISLDSLIKSFGDVGIDDSE